MWYCLIGDYIFNLDADELPNKWLMKNIKDVSKNDNILPENIDYSASMERLFPE